MSSSSSSGIEVDAAGTAETGRAFVGAFQHRCVDVDGGVEDVIDGQPDVGEPGGPQIAPDAFRVACRQHGLGLDHGHPTAGACEIDGETQEDRRRIHVSLDGVAEPVAQQRRGVAGQCGVASELAEERRIADHQIESLFVHQVPVDRRHGSDRVVAEVRPAPGVGIVERTGVGRHFEQAGTAVDALFVQRGRRRARPGEAPQSSPADVRGREIDLDP